MRIAFIVALLLLAGCASAPRDTRNACAIFDQRDGWLDNWQRAANHAERQYGVPVPILMATIYTESGFRPNARPPRTKLLGFIPWKRQSTAYGFSQALNGTWSEYKSSTGNVMARRTKFSDAIHLSPGITTRTAGKTASPATMPTISIWPIISAMPLSERRLARQCAIAEGRPAFGQYRQCLCQAAALLRLILSLHCENAGSQ